MSRVPSSDGYRIKRENIESRESDKFYSRPRMVAYVGEDETLDSVCQMIVSAMYKNITLRHLIIHTLIEDVLKSKLSQCQDYDKVKDRIQIVQSENKRCYLDDMHCLTKVPSYRWMSSKRNY